MSTISKQTQLIPNCPHSNIPYSKFLSQIEQHSTYLSKQQNKTSPQINTSDITLIENYFKEITEYSSLLIINYFHFKAKPLLKLALIMIHSYEKILINIPPYFKPSNNLTQYIMLIKVNILKLALKVFYFEKDYIKSNKIVNEIIHIQTTLNAPPCEKAQVYYYSTLIKAKTNNSTQAKAHAKIFLALADIIKRPVFFKENEDNDNNDKGIRKIKQISEILDILGNIYESELNKNKAIQCYTKAYYINSDNSRWEYFNKKIQNLKNSMVTYKNNNNNELNDSDEDEYEDIKFKSCDKNGNTNMNSYINTIEDEGYDDKYFLYQMLFCDKVMNKGKTNTYAFAIPKTNNLEPMIISIYSLPSENEKENDNNKHKHKHKNEINKLFQPERFVDNIYLNKTTLLQFLGKNQLSYIDNNNILYYTDTSLNKILQSFTLNSNNQMLITNPNILNCIIKPQIFNNNYYSRKKKITTFSY